jgi:NAD(P)-dependent dehydrogenase (short-subunit alcohol dehydrogenase family)
MDTAVVVGVGPVEGLGAQLCLRFAREGLHVFAAGRTQGALEDVARAVRGAGGNATPVVCDATDPEQIAALFEKADAAGGALALVVYNAGNAAFGDLLQMDPEYFEAVWRIGCFGGFLTGREAGRRMVEKGRGTILFTGASASVRGRPPFGAFASSKAALRSLAQTFARDLGPRGVHVGHVIIDGAIGGEKIKSNLPQVAEALGDDGMVGLEGLAHAYWSMHVQPKNAWTFELDVRPYKEKW